MSEGGGVHRHPITDRRLVLGHLERYLGPIEGGWSPSDFDVPPPCQVVYCGTSPAVPGVFSIATLGMSDLPLHPLPVEEVGVVRVVWALPLATAEAEALWRLGRDRWEHHVEAIDPDLCDLTRPPMSFPID